MDPESFSRATDPTFQFVPGLGTKPLKTWPNWQIWGVHNGIGARPFRHVLDFLRICVPKVCNLRRIGPFWGKIWKKIYPGTVHISHFRIKQVSRYESGTIIPDPNWPKSPGSGCIRIHNTGRAIEGAKKSLSPLWKTRFSLSTPSNGPSYGFPRLKIILIISRVH